jgi:hypothetical protein
MVWAVLAGDFHGSDCSVFLPVSFPDWDSVPDWHFLQAPEDFLQMDWAEVDWVGSPYCFSEGLLVCSLPDSDEAGFRMVAGWDSVQHFPDWVCPDSPAVSDQKVVCFRHRLLAVLPDEIRKTVSFSFYFLRISYQGQSDLRFSLPIVLLQ